MDLLGLASGHIYYFLHEARGFLLTSETASKLMGKTPVVLWWLFFLNSDQVVPQEYGYTLIKTPAALTNFMARQTGRSRATQGEHSFSEKKRQPFSSKPDKTRVFYISEWYSLIDTLGCSHFSMKGPFDSLVCHSINFLRCPSSCAAATLVSGQRRS